MLEHELRIENLEDDVKKQLIINAQLKNRIKALERKQAERAVALKEAGKQVEAAASAPHIRLLGNWFGKWQKKQ